MTDHRAPRDERVESSILPIVAPNENRVPTWIFAIAVGVSAILLFLVLETERRAAQLPAVQRPTLDLADVPSFIPMLEIPPESARTPVPVTGGGPPPSLLTIPFGSPLGSAPLAARRTPPVSPLAAPYVPPPNETAPPPAGSPAVVIDTSTSSPAGSSPSTSSSANGQITQNGSLSDTPARAGRLADRSTTFIQGTLIHAVL